MKKYLNSRVPDFSLIKAVKPWSVITILISDHE